MAHRDRTSTRRGPQPGASLIPAAQEIESLERAPWIAALPLAVQTSVSAFVDPRPPGARARAQLAAQAIVELVRGWPVDAPGLPGAVDDLVANLNAAGQTTLHQPGVGNMIRAVLAGGLEGPRDTVLERMTQAYERASEAMAAASGVIAAAGSALLADGDRILVHDFADRSTQAVVRQAAADGKHLTVVATACRSRRTDGIRVARESRAVGHEAIVVTDAGVGWAVASMRPRLCFIGADAVLPDGSVLTTPGALAIGLVGRRYGVPIYAVTDLWKVMTSVSPELVVVNELEDPDGVPETLDWKAAGYGYRNPLIDIVPGDTLTGLVTEAGVIRPERAGAEATARYGALGGDA
jgi:translation initiation factor 2B subunit (eIF-2B alpha/beta/delta family)